MTRIINKATIDSNFQQYLSDLDNYIEEIRNIKEVVSTDTNFLSDNKNMVLAMNYEIQIIESRLNNIASKATQMQEIIDTNLDDTEEQ